MKDENDKARAGTLPRVDFSAREAGRSAGRNIHHGGTLSGGGATKALGSGA